VNEPTGAIWRTSTRSGNNGNCVEVATNLLDRDGKIYLRDTKDHGHGPVLGFTRAEWDAFRDGLLDGEFTI
jgi:hypothetical protein